MNNTLTPINDISSLTFDELFSRFQNLDMECLLIYLFDKVDESALVHLAHQFHIMGNEGWSNCSNVQEKRDLIKNSLNLHRFRGTKFALKRVLDILGLNGKVLEWFEYGGTPYHFKIAVDLANKGLSTEVEKALIDLIMANKNVRSKLEELTVNLLITTPYYIANYILTSEEITI